MVKINPAWTRISKFPSIYLEAVTINSRPLFRLYSANGKPMGEFRSELDARNQALRSVKSQNRRDYYSDHSMRHEHAMRTMKGDGQ